MRIGVLALPGDVREHEYIFAKLDVQTTRVRLPQDLDAVDALILPGGESTTLSLLLRSSELVEPLRKRLADGMPAFGTCAGMILLATDVCDGRPDQLHLDAIDISVRRNGYGRQVDSFQADLDVVGEDEQIPAIFIRAPLVERTGDDVAVLARMSGQPVLCQQGPVTVAAFHPELTGDVRIHAKFVESVRRAV